MQQITVLLLLEPVILFQGHRAEYKNKLRQVFDVIAKRVVDSQPAVRLAQKAEIFFSQISHARLAADGLQRQIQEQLQGEADAVLLTGKRLEARQQQREAEPELLRPLFGIEPEQRSLMSNRRAPSRSQWAAFWKGSSMTETISRVPISASPPLSQKGTGR